MTHPHQQEPQPPAVTFAFSLATQFENLGDCLINELLLEELARKGCVVVLARRAPEWLLARLAGRESIVLCQGWGDFLRALASAGQRVLVFKPGHWVARPGLPCLIRLAAVTSVAALLRASGWTLVRFGASLDSYVPAERWWQGVLGRMHSLYGVRDDESAGKARQMGVTAVGYTPDLAFLLPVPGGSSDEARGSIALSMRQRPWMGQDGTAVLAPMAALAERLRQEDCPLRVVQQVGFDDALSGLLAQRLGCTRVNFAQSEDSVKAVQRAYASSSVVISNRLHGLLFGWAGGAIPLAVVDDRHDLKITALFRKLGLDELLLPAASVDELTGRVLRLLERRQQWTQRLNAVFSAEQRILRDVLASAPWTAAPQPKRA